MNRTTSLSLLLAATLFSFSARPAGAQEGRLLTMEEAVFSSKVYPAGISRTKADSLLGIVPSPESRVYTRGNGLYWRADDGSERTIAESEAPGIVYGTSVSRNEFGITSGIFPSPDGRKIAYYRKDERAVTLFPLLDITSRTGSLVQLRYPMNGMASEHISLHVYDTASGSTLQVQVDDFDAERYLTGITWSPEGKYLFIQVLDRAQKHMHLNMYRADDGRFIRTLLTEENDAFVEPQDPLYFLKDSYLFLFRTDNRDGWKNLYLCDTLGTVQRLVHTDADLAYLADNGKTVWYTSAEISPIENHLFCVSVKPGRKGTLPAKVSAPRQLTRERGWHTIRMAPGCDRYLDSWSRFDVPRKVELCRADDGTCLEPVFSAPDPLAGYLSCQAKLGTVKSADGRYDNAYRLFLPAGFDPQKKYPLIVYVYGGPHSQMVRDTWLGGIRMWEMYMAQRGYVVYVQDNRGTSNQGAAYEKAIHRRCGQVEMEDQMVGIRQLLEQPWIDRDRVGVHGWSYGGFMTISLMTHYPDVFKVGVAGGPVIDWKWYEVMYGERYMETEATNPEGFAQTSLINRAKDLKGKLLICQGAIDDTVVWEHSLSFVQACIKAGKQVDYFPYPCEKHNVRGKDRIHLMDKVTLYFEDYL